MEDKDLENRNNKRTGFNVSSEVYSKIYSSYFYDGLEEYAEVTLNNAEEQRKANQAIRHIKQVVNLFLEDGRLEKDDFLNAAPTLFSLQPSVGEYKSARKEVLRISEELLNDNIFDDIFLEESKDKREYYLNEHYFILYHYLSRYWAVRERADATISPDTELAICYRNICLSVEAIYALKKRERKEADDFIQQKLGHLKPKIANRYGYFLDKEEEEQDSDYTIKLLRRANAIRLCWLWDRIVIEQYIATAHALLLPVTIFASYVSFGLYLFLASIHITGVFGAYFEALANNERLKIEAKKVLWAHTKLRKDIIINDLIWGMANLACVFWLCGFGLYANIGDLLTGLLLVMDLGMSIWSYKSEKKEYEDDIAGYNKQLIALINRMGVVDQTKGLRDAIISNKYSLANTLLKNLKSNSSYWKSQEDKDKWEIICWKLKEIHDKKENRYNAWQDKNLLLYSNIFYAAVLVVAFSAFCGFYLSFFPITLPLFIALMGGMMLAASTLVWRSANSYIECRTIDRKKNKARDDYEELVKEFINNNSRLSEIKQKQLCLKILQKGAQVAYQDDKLLYKKLETLRETANRLLIPGAIVLTFLFLPASVVGVPMYVFLLLGIGIAAVGLSMYIKKYYAPKGTKWIDENGVKRRDPSLTTEEFSKFKAVLLDESCENKSEQLLKFIKDSRTGDKKISFPKDGFFVSGGEHKKDEDSEYTSLLNPKKIN